MDLHRDGTTDQKTTAQQLMGSPNTRNRTRCVAVRVLGCESVWRQDPAERTTTGRGCPATMHKSMVGRASAGITSCSGCVCCGLLSCAESDRWICRDFCSELETYHVLERLSALAVVPTRRTPATTRIVISGCLRPLLVVATGLLRPRRRSGRWGYVEVGCDGDSISHG